MVDLSNEVPTPRRRGRPPGSKNKKKTTARRTTAATTRTPRIPKLGQDRGVLIEKDGESTKFTFFDQTGKEVLVRTIPMDGLVFDRR